MALDLQNRPDDSGSDELDPEQRHYDETFNRLTSAEHMAETGDSGSPQGANNDPSDNEAGADEKLGLGYRKDDKGGRGSLLSRMSSGGKLQSKTKKKLAIAGGLAAGSLLGSILVFFLMLPLKIESIINNLDNRFGAASSQAIGDETQHMFKQYVIKYIVPNLGKGNCHSTVDAGCVSVIQGSGPVTKMYQGWKQDRLEQKLATKYNLSIGKSGKNYYINDGGKRIVFGDKESDVFSDHHTTVGQRNEIESILAKRIKEGTLWDRVYYRFKLAPLLNKKYGIRHCINACKPINKFTDKVATKKQAAKAYMVQRVVSPLGESYGLILQCVLADSNACSTHLDNADSDNPERQTGMSKQLQTQLDNAAERFGKDALEKLVQDANDVSKEGFQKYIAKKIAEKVGSLIGGDAAGAASAEAAEKAVPVVGWILLAVKMAHLADEIGPMIRYLTYAANAAAAAQVYTTYQTVASEAKSGQIDATQLGSFNTALSTNLSGTATDSSDATETPLYQSLMSSTDSGTQTGWLSGSFSQTTLAASSSSTGSYVCNDGKSVPSGQTVCDEEVLNRGNKYTNDISALYDKITNPASRVVVDVISGAVGKVSGLIGWVTGKPFELACKIPGCHSALDYVAGKVGDIMNTILNKMVASPVTSSMSGGRIFDMMAAGADVSHNASCQADLGCAQISNQQAAAIQHQYLAAQQQDFGNRPLFARMFSTDSPYSMVSRMSLALPGSTSSVSTNIASFITTNPLGIFGKLAASFIPGSRATADGSSKDPFGIPQTGYSQGDIPTDPEGFFEQHCMGGNGPDQEGVYDAATNTLDTSAWQNDDANVKQDESTGQAVYVHPNKCQLIFSSLQSAGGLADPSLLPKDSLISDQTSTQGGTQFRIATFNMRVHTTSAQNQVAVNNIKNNHFDIVGMQELSHPELFGSVKSKLSAIGYDIYPQQYSGNWDMNSTAITWNSSRFELVKTDSMTYPAGSKATPASVGAATTSPILWLKDKATGQEIIVTNAHTFAFGPAYGGPALRSKAAQIFTEKIQGLQPEGLPIFFTGDFNEGYGPLGTAYCMMETQHLMISPFVDNPSEYCKAGGKVWAMGAVDHILTSPGIKGTPNELKASGSRGAGGVWDNLGTDHRQVPYADVVVPGSGGTGGNSLRIATFNVQGAIHTPTWKGRMDKSINVLLSNHIEVSGLQEFEANQRQYFLASAGSTYDIYPAKLVTDGNESQNSIIWDKTKFSLVKGGVQPNLKYFHEKPLHSPWVLLKNISTGQQFYVLNTHDPAHSGKGYETMPYYRYQNALQHVAFVKSLEQQGDVPIFYTGDFNSGYSLNSGGNKTYQNKNENLTYCIMTKGGLMNDAIDLSASRKVTCPNPTNEGGADHIYMTPGIKVTGIKKVPPSQNGSDVHATIIVDVTLP